MRTLVIPVGCPGSGKTYFCNEIFNRYGIKSVSSDQVRENLYGDAAIQGDYHEVFDTVYNTINSLFDNGENIVILDATNVTRHVRCKAIFDTSPTEIIYVIMPNNLQRSLENNENRKRIVPRKVVRRMYDSYKRDMPCSDKDFFNEMDCSIYHLDDESENAELDFRLENCRG